METAVKGIRQTKQGSWEVAHYQDGVRKSRTFKSLAEAEEFKISHDKSKVVSKPTLGGVISDYLSAPNLNVASSTREVLERLTRMGDKVEDIDDVWADRWISDLKKTGVTPSTIKKKVSPVANVLSWHFKMIGDPGRYNPLTNLSKNYASYGKGGPMNVQRNRRLFNGEQQIIAAAIMGVWKGKNRERFYATSDEDRAAFCRLFLIIVETGMRLREAFTLKNRDFVMGEYPYIDLKRPSKGGFARQIPIKPQLLDILRGIEIPANDDPFFPFWSGVESEEILRQIGNKLSHRFSSLFRYCGCDDLVEHDLRHEAICRWLEMKDANGHWLLRSEEVRMISGHKSTRAFDIYVSMRGKDFVPRIYSPSVPSMIQTA